MIPLSFMKKDEKERRNTVDQYYQYLMEKGRRGSFLDVIEQWCERYLKSIEGVNYSFEMVIKAELNILEKIRIRVDTALKKRDINNGLKHMTPKNKEKCYIVDNLYKGMSAEARDFLIKSLDVNVCPYCNRNYIYSSGKTHTCQLDHYYPKGKYPILAVSFYNLIPVCASCNLSKKETNFEFYPHTETDVDELLKFSFEFEGLNYLKDKQDIRVTTIPQKRKYIKQIKKLGLGELYQKHNDVVQEIIRKNQLNSTTYIHSLYEENKNIFESESEVENMVYSNYLGDDEVGLRSLGKLTRDIVEELKLYEKLKGR